MAKSRMPDVHRCPKKGCDVIVPNRLFACLPHWNALPVRVKTLIRVTSNRGLLDSTRISAIENARKAWGDL